MTRSQSESARHISGRGRKAVRLFVAMALGACVVGGLLGDLGAWRNGAQNWSMLAFGVGAVGAILFSRRARFGRALSRRAQRRRAP